MSSYASGIHLLRTKAKEKGIPQCEMLIEMTQYYFMLYSHMNMYCIFKDFSSYEYSLNLASFCIWLTNHIGFFPGVYPSIKFSDFCSLLDAANMMCPITHLPQQGEHPDS